MSEIFNLNVLCRCCLKDGYFRDLHHPYVSKEGVEVYSAWLRETFGITLESPCMPASNMICEDCISRLSDARRFRRQVEDSESKFQFYCRNEGHVKEEPPDDDLATNKQENDLTEDKNDVKIKVEIKTSDDELSDHFDFYDPTPNHESNIGKSTPSVAKKGKREKPVAKVAQSKRQRSTKHDLQTKKLQEKDPTKDKDDLKIEVEIKPSDDELSDHFDFDDPSRNRESKTVEKKTTSVTKRGRKKKTVSKIARKRRGSRSPKSKSITEIVCRLCQKTVKDVRKFDIHVKKVHNQFKMGVCDYCQKVFTHRVTLERHIRALHLRLARAYPCHVCGHRFDSVTYVRSHVRMVHENIRAYQCEYCVKSFKAKKALTEHTRRKHTKETPYVCHICTAGFVTGYELNLHVKAHDKPEESDTKNKNPKPKGRIRLYKCSLCSNTFENRKAHRHHIKVDHRTARLPFPCELCNKSFTDKYILKRHMFTHETGQFQCEYCFNTYQHEYILKQHIKRTHGKRRDGETHQDIKEHVKCYLCNRLVKNMEKHNESHQKRPYKCELCYRTYSAKNALRKHIKDTHLQMYQYNCDVCFNKFIKLKTAYAHRKRKHPDAPPVKSHRALKIKVDCDGLDDFISVNGVIK